MRRSLIIDTHASSCYFRTSVEGDGRKALIQITERCNLHCAHCFVSSGDWGEHLSRRDIADKLLPRLLRARVERVTLTGGEPFAHPDLPAICDAVVALGLPLGVCTNATLASDEQIAQLARSGAVHVNVRILSNRSSEADYGDFPRELLRSLEAVIDDVKARNGWLAEDALRLIFHVFKPLKDTEAQAVKALVEKLTGQYAAVEFAFVHVSDEHDWAIFDQSSAGVGSARRSRTAKGRLVPGRGHAVQISRSEMLLSVTGPFDMKLPLQGLPRPLRLKLHRESTFTDLEYLAGQVFRFTALSWRRPYPSGHPVTIMYSDLIASLLGQLRHVKNWNADVVSTSLRASRWFL